MADHSSEARGCFLSCELVSDWNFYVLCYTQKSAARGMGLLISCECVSGQTFFVFCTQQNAALSRRVLWKNLSLQIMSSKSGSGLKNLSESKFQVSGELTLLSSSTK